MRKITDREIEYVFKYNRALKMKMFKTNKFYEASILMDLINQLERLNVPLKAAYQAKKFRWQDGHERALLDLYFKQVDTTIECDEAYHKGNAIADMQRVKDADLKKVIRIDATMDEASVRRRVDEIALALKDDWVKNGCPMAEICDHEWSMGFIMKNDEIKVSDNLFIGGNGNKKNVSLLNALGIKSNADNDITSFQCSTKKINDNLYLWMPRDTAELSSRKKNLEFNKTGIGDNETWNEYLDGKIIEHINLSAGKKNRNSYIRKMLEFNGDLVRIVWRRNRNECGEEGLRYIGNYSFKKAYVVNEGDAVMEWEKSSDSFKKSSLVKNIG